MWIIFWNFAPKYKYQQNYNRIKIVLAEKNLPNKYLAEKLCRDQATICNSRF